MEKKKILNRVGKIYIKMQQELRKLRDKIFDRRLDKRLDKRYKTLVSQTKFDMISKRLVDEIDETKFEKLKRQYPADIDIYGSVKLSYDEIIGLVGDFFATIDKDYANIFKDLINGRIKGRANFNMNLHVPSSETTCPRRKNELIGINVPLTGDLKDAYNLVHEFTHFLDRGNGENVTRMILGEIAPQCMERLFDEYLKNLSLAQLQKYGFNLRELEDAIFFRRRSTTINRIGKGMKLNNIGNDIKSDQYDCVRYMFAEIYQRQFLNRPIKSRIPSIKELLEACLTDNYVKAQRTFDFSFEKIVGIINSIIGDDLRTEREGYEL